MALRIPDSSELKSISLERRTLIHSQNWNSYSSGNMNINAYEAALFRVKSTGLSRSICFHGSSPSGQRLNMEISACKHVFKPWPMPLSLKPCWKNTCLLITPKQTAPSCDFRASWDSSLWPPCSSSTTSMPKLPKWFSHHHCHQPSPEQSHPPCSGARCLPLNGKEWQQWQRPSGQQPGAVGYSHCTSGHPLELPSAREASQPSHHGSPLPSVRESSRLCHPGTKDKEIKSTCHSTSEGESQRNGTTHISGNWNPKHGHTTQKMDHQ